jgi:hypothetical protein
MTIRVPSFGERREPGVAVVTVGDGIAFAAMCVAIAAYNIAKWHCESKKQ